VTRGRGLLGGRRGVVVCVVWLSGADARHDKKESEEVVRRPHCRFRQQFLSPFYRAYGSRRPRFSCIVPDA